MRWLKGFLTFTIPTKFRYLYRRFQLIHNQQNQTYDNWPIAATRHRLIAEYWFWAFMHYFAIIVLGSLVTLIFFQSISIEILISICLICTFLYIPLNAFIYRPTFNGDFLSQLENVISKYEGRSTSWAEKCRQGQLSTRGLVLLYYILDKCAEINYLTPSDKSASMLLKIFGVSQKGLKNELDLLFKKEKRAKIEQRKQTEIGKSFEEVYALFEEMQFPKGIQMLKELEIRFNRPE